MEESGTERAKTSLDELDIQKIKSGDEEALRELFEKLLPRIRLITHRVARKYSLHTKIDADDLAQEAIIKIYSSLRKFEPDRGNFEAWCFVVATNVAIEAVRRSRMRSDEVEINEVEEKEALSIDYRDQIDARRLLQEAVSLLPAIEREILMEALNGKTLREISVEKDLSAAAVSRRYSHALATVRSLLLRGKHEAKEEW